MKQTTTPPMEPLVIFGAGSGITIPAIRHKGAHGLKNFVRVFNWNTRRAQRGQFGKIDARRADRNRVITNKATHRLTSQGRSAAIQKTLRSSLREEIV